MQSKAVLQSAAEKTLSKATRDSPSVIEKALKRQSATSCTSLAPLTTSRKSLSSPSGLHGGKRATLVAHLALNSTLMTPSMAKIAGKDKVVELNGAPTPAAFEVGGKNNNIVIRSTSQLVHKGWRIVAIDGQKLEPGASAAASMLAAARKRPKYSVTFRMGEEEDEEALAKAAEVAALLEQEKAAAAAAAACAAASAAAAAEAEEAARKKTLADAEAKKKAAAAAEAAAAAAAEAKQKAAEEAERQKKVEEELKAQRKVVEKELEKAVGLPPREKIADPQQALLQALTQAFSQPPKVEKKKTGPCDKCDGPHHEDDCPYFKKKREEHKDAWDKYGKEGGGEDEGDGKVVVKNAKLVPQPGDGSCLFHSLAYGLRSISADALRAEIADYIASHPETSVAGNPIKDWVLWDSGTDVKTYAGTMRSGSRWGGAVELAVCAQLKSVCVHVYERGSRGFARISAFGDAASSGSGRRIVNLHYGGRVHYDALEL
eukprot:TRINITY_DN4052_c0_g1_i1.p1 TRINITY_DN4052_c0_g1~~TRINITY_DN4052_c0_g1_i1.p1  ORF type:complete len:488 (-),score=152.03 TRINITY_DN4052_c0_g1_i1:92-1555(-)